MAAIEPDQGLEEVEIRSGDSTIRVGDAASLLGDGSSLDGAVSAGIAESVGDAVGIRVDDGIGALGLADDIEAQAVRRPHSAQSDSRWDDFGAIEMMMARVGSG